MANEEYFHELELEKTAAKNYKDKTELLHACKLAYRKYHLGDDSIGSDELGYILYDAICNAIGEREYLLWMEKVKKF